MIDCFGTAHASQNPKHCDLPDIHELRQSIQQFVATHCEASGRCKGWATKTSFRAEWAKSALSNLQTSKQHSKSYQEVEVSRGTYLSSEKIWDEGVPGPRRLQCSDVILRSCHKAWEQMDETERHDRQSRILVPSESFHGDLV